MGDKYAEEHLVGIDTAEWVLESTAGNFPRICTAFCGNGAEG